MVHSIIVRFIIFHCVINLPFNVHQGGSCGFGALSPILCIFEYWSSFILSPQGVDLWYSQPLMFPLQIKITNWNRTLSTLSAKLLPLLWHYLPSFPTAPPAPIPDPRPSRLGPAPCAGSLSPPADNAALLKVDSGKLSESGSNYHQPNLATSFCCWPLPLTLDCRPLYHHRICTVHSPLIFMGNLPPPDEFWISYYSPLSLPVPYGNAN